MTKTRFLALVTALALLLTIPTAVLAQNARPHVFVGTVTLDGATAVDGAAVTAWIDGQQVMAGNVTDGTYVLQIESPNVYAGKTVSFKVSGANAAETFVWEEGEATELNLVATSGSTSEGGTGETGETGQVGPSSQIRRRWSTSFVTLGSAGAGPETWIHPAIH